MDLSLVIPCYNEEKNLPILITKLERILENKKYEVLLVDNGWVKCSIVKDILCDLYISGFRGEGQIMGYANAPCPTPRALENAYYPTPTSIAMEILKMLNKSTDLFIPESPELASFKGPF